MRFTSVVVVAAVWLVPGAAAGDDKAAAKPSDAEISRLLVGAWHGEDHITGVEGTIRYAKDGTFTADGMVPLNGSEKVEFKAEGTWKVSGGAIYFTVTKSSRPGLAPPGFEVKEVVLGIDDQTVRYKRGLGRVKTRTRVK